MVFGDRCRIKAKEARGIIVENIALPLFVF